MSIYIAKPSPQNAAASASVRAFAERGLEHLLRSSITQAGVYAACRDNVASYRMYKANFYGFVQATCTKKVAWVDPQQYGYQTVLPKGLPDTPPRYQQRYAINKYILRVQRSLLTLFTRSVRVSE